MMTFICSCSNEDCYLFGCEAVEHGYPHRTLTKVYPTAQPTQQFPWNPPATQRSDPPPLTADDIRRIVREEIEREKENNDAAR